MGNIRSSAVLHENALQRTSPEITCRDSRTAQDNGKKKAAAK
jgi:hypothetical protein